MRLPTRLNIRNEATRRSDFKGTIAKELFTRFPQDTVKSINSDAQVELHCAFDHYKNPVCQGTAIINVTSTCMRCCEDYSYDVVAHFTLAPASSEEQADNLPMDYSPLLIDEFGEVNLTEGIEEELIMNIALTPKHEDDNCFDSEQPMTFGDQIEEETTSSNNPFEALKALKGKLGK
ncbi:YceD family protein [Psittacicella hinzii]|uniref:Large ribosomal RNA subunit accumulation protein YceD n=1 Tax=Psittacicella hinzii TaxID=2028575 RepID=A0A3A1YBP3_9GAMM|nr:YceD family protein [Psittacicella hinzii]RIY35105.1 hypothetical protein CKF58_07070 [Psittacicella hinzii]